MTKVFIGIIIGVAIQLTAYAQDGKIAAASSKAASSKEVRTKRSSQSLAKDRNYWQDGSKLKKLKKKGKKNCDCPSTMTAKQRRKYRFH